jgi:hypothetical protein
MSLLHWNPASKAYPFHWHVSSWKPQVPTDVKITNWKALINNRVTRAKVKEQQKN